MSLSGMAMTGIGVSARSDDVTSRASGDGDLTATSESRSPIGFGYGGPLVVASGAPDGETGGTAVMKGERALNIPSLTGRNEAERFDRGGEGEAYHDTDARNAGGAFRDTGVDLQETSDTGGGYNIGWIEDGEWWAYTRECAGGQYIFTVRVASPDGGSELILKIDGTEYGRVTIPKTGGWQQWTTERFGTFDLDGGVRVIRLEAVGGDFNINWFAAGQREETPPPTPTPTPTPTSTPASTQEPFGGVPADIPGRIQVEHYDEGSEGVAYHDTDPQWSGRPESDALRGDTRVDLQATSDTSGRYNVGRFSKGEWLEYTVAPEAGTYDLSLRVATPHDDRQLWVGLNGRTLRTVDIPNTGDWNAYRTVTVRDVRIDTDRTGILQLKSLRSGIDVNWLEFEARERSPTATPTPITTPTPDGDNDDYAEQRYGAFGYGGIV